MVEPLQSSINPTLPLVSDLYQVIEPMPSLVNPTLPSESEFHEVVESNSVSINPTIPLESEVSTSHIFFTASSELTKQGDIELALDQPPPSSRIASFDWDSLVEPCLPFDAPFQIKVKVEPCTIARCIFYEGALVSILSAYSW